MVVRWPLTPTIDQGYDTQKAARVNGPGKTKEKGRERNLERQSQKKCLR